MSFREKFEQELDNLFYERTHWLRNEIGVKKVSPPPKFDRKKVDKGIKKLQEIVSEALAKKQAKTEFDQFAEKKKTYSIKGFGIKEKKKLFENWVSQYLSESPNFIYIFWDKNKKCLYVGKTGQGGSRPASHFEKFWFSSVAKAVIYPVHLKSHIPKLECLARHHFRPSRNKIKPATKKWTKVCPLCASHKYIERELRSIFRLK